MSSLPAGTLIRYVIRLRRQGTDAAILIVGHEPALSMLISTIISGEGSSSVVLAKGGLAKIGNYSFTGRPSGDLKWLVTPKLILKGQ